MQHIIVLRSNFLLTLRRGDWGKMDFTIGEEEFDRPYFLVDGIYPEWAIFAKPIAYPILSEADYVALQESIRKDIERCFGVLQQRWKFLRDPCRLHNLEYIYLVIKACIILHNMIVEGQLSGEFTGVDARGVRVDLVHEFGDERPTGSNDIKEIVGNIREIEDRLVHYRLRNALISHITNQPST